MTLVDLARTNGACPFAAASAYAELNEVVAPSIAAVNSDAAFAGAIAEVLPADDISATGSARGNAVRRPISYYLTVLSSPESGILP